MAVGCMLFEKTSHIISFDASNWIVFKILPWGPLIKICVPLTGHRSDSPCNVSSWIVPRIPPRCLCKLGVPPFDKPDQTTREWIN